MRVLIIGASGVGKTTIARKIRDQYRLPLIELDDYFGGKRLPQEEADAIVDKVLAENSGWIIEGAYIFPKLFKEATHIIHVEVPYLKALLQSWKRYFIRMVSKENLYGNKSLFLTTKHITKMYFSKELPNNYKSFRIGTVREFEKRYPEKFTKGRELLQGVVSD